MHKPKHPKRYFITAAICLVAVLLVLCFLQSNIGNYASVQISAQVLQEQYYELDIASLQFFKFTNHRAMLCKRSDALDAYFSPANQKETLVKRGALRAQDMLVYVNNNYLAHNPLRDTDGNEIHVPEEAVGLTLLVPNDFEINQQELLDYFQPWFTTLYYYTEDLNKLGIEGAQEATHPPLPVNLIVYDAQEKVIDLPKDFSAPLVWVVTQESVTASQQINFLTTGSYVVENDKIWMEEMLLQSGLKPFVKRVANVKL